MRKVILITTAVLTIVACDQPQPFDGSASEDSCPEVPDVNPEGEQDPDSTPSDDDPRPGTLVPEDELVHDVSVSIEKDAAGIADVLIEFEVGSDHTGAIHLVHAPQMMIELVDDGQTLVAVEADVELLKTAAQAGVSCGTVLDEYYEVVFADPEFLASSAQDGTTQTYAVAMQLALAQSPGLNDLMAGSGDDTICEEECDAGSAILGTGLGSAGAAACCIGTTGLGCIPCAGVAGAAGAILGQLASGACKGLFC